jgi:cytochrome d ubiquinol oxidase subunit I
VASVHADCRGRHWGDFSLEGAALFVAAIFLGLSLYGEGRLSRRAQLLVANPMAVAAAASAVFVISADAGTCTPPAFTLVDGRVANVEPWKTVFNPAIPS